MRATLATAIIDAVEARHWPSAITLVDLAAYFHGPRIHYAAPELLRRLPEVVEEILRQLYERTEDPALMDAAERPDPAAIEYRRRVGTVGSHVKINQWPPALSPVEGPAASTTQGVANAS